MRYIAFRFPVERAEGEDAEETLPRFAALIEVCNDVHIVLAHTRTHPDT